MFKKKGLSLKILQPPLYQWRRHIFALLHLCCFLWSASLFSYPLLHGSLVTRRVIQPRRDNYLAASIQTHTYYPLAHLDSAGHCTSWLPPHCRHTAARSRPPPGTPALASASRRRRTWSSHSTDPTDSTGHSLQQDKSRLENKHSQM